MADEIERKYLASDPGWRPTGRANHIVQGYFWLGENAKAQISRDVRDIFTLTVNLKNDKKPWRFVLPQADGNELYDATKGKPLTSAWTLRVRNSDSHGGELCIKGKPRGIGRPEFEYPLSPRDTLQLLKLCTGTHVEKDRYTKRFGGYVWEVDVFAKPLEGEPAVMIEVELPKRSIKPEQPAWVGPEVSHLKGYSNAALARRRWLAHSNGR